MHGTHSSLDELAAACASIFPPFDEREPRIAVSTHRALAEARPASAGRIAEATGLKPSEVASDPIN